MHIKGKKITIMKHNCAFFPAVYYYYDYCYFYSAYEASLTIFDKVDQKHHDQWTQVG
jgi:hypothetical protein